MRILRTLFCLLAIFLATASASAQSLYASAAAGATGRLYRLNPATGAVIQDIGPLNDVTGLNYPITGLAFHPTTGRCMARPEIIRLQLQAIRHHQSGDGAGDASIGSFNAGPTNDIGNARDHDGLRSIRPANCLESVRSVVHNCIRSTCRPVRPL